jgi:hypothetical protein
MRELITLAQVSIRKDTHFGTKFKKENAALELLP